MAMEEEDEDLPPLTDLESNKSLKQRDKISKMQWHQKPNKKQVFGPPRGHKVRAVNEMDFAAALKKVKRTGETAQNFRDMITVMFTVLIVFVDLIDRRASPFAPFQSISS